MTSRVFVWRLVRVGAGRQGKGGHSGGAALMVAQQMAMLNRRCCDGGKVGLSLVGLGRTWGVSIGAHGNTVAPDSCGAYIDTGAPIMLLDHSGL